MGATFAKWSNGGFLTKFETTGLPKQVGNNGDNDGSYLSHGGFLGKLETTGATYRNNVDKDGGYLCQIKPWGLPKQIVNNGGYLLKQSG